jgi:hypothetical protein
MSNVLKVRLQATFYSCIPRLVPAADRTRALDRSRNSWPLFSVRKTSHFNRRQSHSEPRRSDHGQGGGWAQRAMHLPGFGGGKRFHGFLPVDKAICAQAASGTAPSESGAWSVNRARTAADFGLGVPIGEGQAKGRRSWVVRLVLSYSRKGYSEAATRQDAETFLRRLKNGLRSFGGSPLFPTKPAGAAQARKSQGVPGTESPDSCNNTLKAENHVSALSAEVHGTFCCLLEIISRTYALARCSGFLLGAIRQFRWDPYGAETNRKLH